MVLIQLRVSSVIVDKTEVEVIEIIPIPFLLPLMPVIGFPIGQPCGCTGPLQSLGSLEFPIPPELYEHACGFGRVGWWFDRRRRHVLP